MTYFPIYIQVPNYKEVLLIGGGKVAYQKLTKLRMFNMKVHLIATQVDFSILESFISEASNSENDSLSEEDDIRIEEREFEDSDISEDYVFVIAATNNRELNSHIAELCNARNIPINVVDDPQLSTFIFPSIVKRDDVVISISSGGRVPVLTQYFKDYIEELLKDKIEDCQLDNMSELLDDLESYRDSIKDTVSNHKERAALIRKRIENYMENKGEA